MPPARCPEIDEPPVFWKLPLSPASSHRGSAKRTFAGCKDVYDAERLARNPVMRAIVGHEGKI
jgi:hypothetical protein